MRMYKDKNTGSEIFTDIYKMDVIDDVIYEIEGKNISRAIDASNVDIGANASQEEAAEDLETASESGPNFVLNCRLRQMKTKLSKKEYATYMKPYLKSLSLDSEKQAKVTEYMKKVLSKFKEFDQYMAGEDYMDPSDNKLPMVLLVNYRDETDNPYMICFKDGLVEEKL